MRFRIWHICIAVLLSGLVVMARTPPVVLAIEIPATTDQAQAADRAQKAATANTVGITGVVQSNSSPNSPDVRPVIAHALNGITTNSETELGHPITIVIPGLRAWAKGHDPRTLRVYLAGNMLPMEEPTLVSIDQEYANFLLSPHTSDAQDRAKWFGILEEARRQYRGSIPISAGPMNELQPFESHEFIRLRVYPSYTGWVVAALGCLLIALIFLGHNSSLLRDGSSRSSPYSLGQMQMAWWFYLVVAAYIYLWLITGQVNMLTPSVLALIGISAGTGLAAIFVDQQKGAAGANQRTQFIVQQTALQSRIAELERANPAAGTALDVELQAKKAELAQVSASLAALPPVPPAPTSKGLIDILRDGNGISFHRFQIVVWTIVFGIIFVRAVLKDLTMPDFDSSLLGLMGLSSGTYIGFKFPEPPK
jgi:hypothetical protein